MHVHDNHMLKEKSQGGVFVFMGHISNIKVPITKKQTNRNERSG